MKSADFPLRFSHPLPTGEVKVGGGNTKKNFPLVECVANTGQQTAADNRYLSPGTGLHTH